MKHLNFYFLVLCFASLIVSCQKETVPKSVKIDQENSCPALLTLQEFDYIGALHNSFLQNVYENFEESDYPSNLTLDSKIEYLNTFQKSYAATLMFSAQQQADMNTSLDQFKQLVDPNVTYSSLFTDCIYMPGQPVTIALTQMKAQGFIDQFEFNTITSLLSLVQQNHNSQLEAVQLRDEILSLRSNWNEQGYTQCSTTGRVSAIILSVSLYSVDWWIAHPNASNTDRVAPWIAADVAGGIYGTVGWAMGSAYSGNFDGGNLAIAVVGGAISGSTGIVGKIARWLF
jgi:hypothetical protein